jgi:hypothetical protein
MKHIGKLENPVKMKTYHIDRRESDYLPWEIPKGIQNESQLQYWDLN